MTLDERIARYLDKIPGAISGSDGHGQTFTVACALVNGFALDADAALRHLTTYNATCSPPWSPRELRHKVVQAEKTAHSKPRGYLLGSDADRRPEAGQVFAKVVPVRLAARKRHLRTLRTTFFNPYAYAGRETEIVPPYIAGVGAKSSEASEPAAAGLSTFVDTSIGIPTDHALDWTAINAQFPPTPEDEAWRAVGAAGFGDEPLITLAFSLFGPGCQVIPTGEAASV